jgi:hypothetical protein
MGSRDYTEQSQYNIGYAVRLTMANPPRAPPVELEDRLVAELSNPPHDYHVQATRFKDECSMTVYAEGPMESIVEHGLNLRHILDSYHEDMVYGIAPLPPLGHEDVMSLGKILRELRKAKKTDKGKSYSIRKAASEIGVSHTHLRRLENDQKLPSLGILKEMAKFYQFDEFALASIAIGQLETP